MARLIWKRTENPDEDVTFDLGEGSLIIGRDPKCAIFIDAALVSREHARVDFRDGAHVLVDLGSTNFTKVNGERFSERALAPNDQIQISRARCVYAA